MQNDVRQARSVVSTPNFAVNSSDCRHRLRRFTGVRALARPFHSERGCGRFLGVNHVAFIVAESRLLTFYVWACCSAVSVVYPKQTGLY